MVTDDLTRVKQSNEISATIGIVERSGSTMTPIMLADPGSNAM